MRLARAAIELPIDTERAWSLLTKTAVQMHLSRGFFTYGDQLPAHRAEGFEAASRLKLLGVLPAWVHHQRFARVDDQDHELLVEEWGGPYRTWNHLMRLDALSADCCRFVDQIEIDAGTITPLVWLFARSLCRRRTKRMVTVSRLLA